MLALVLRYPKVLKYCAISVLWCIIFGLAACDSDDYIGVECELPSCATMTFDPDTIADFTYPLEPVCIIHPLSGLGAKNILWIENPSDTVKAYLPILSWIKCSGGTNAIPFVDSIIFYQRLTDNIKITTHRADLSLCQSACYIEMVPVLDTIYLVDTLLHFGVTAWSPANTPEACDCEAELRFELIE